MECSVEWCHGKVKCRGYCTPCYSAWYKGKDPNLPRRRKVPKTATDEDRLRFYGWTVTGSGCWEWAGRRDRKEYGVMAIATCKQVFSHRVAYGVWVGPIPDELFVLHHCDNPPCINPNHLFVGTGGDNMRDMTVKERGNTRKLVASQVVEIRSLAGSVSVKDLCSIYGMSKSAMRAVITRETWKHV